MTSWNRSFTTCLILYQKIYNVSEFDSKLYKLADFKLKALKHVGVSANNLLNVRNCKPKFTTLLLFWINFLRKVRSRFQTFTRCEDPTRKICNRSDLEWKFYKVSDSNQAATSCKFSSPIAYNVAEIETKYTTLVRFRLKILQRGGFYNKKFATMLDFD